MISHLIDAVLTLHASYSFETLLGAPCDTPWTRFIRGGSPRATPARQLNSFHLYQCHSLPALRRSPEKLSWGLVHEPRLAGGCPLTRINSRAGPSPTRPLKFLSPKKAQAIFKTFRLVDELLR